MRPRRPLRQGPRPAGFTLIEMLVALIIVSLLTAFAVSAYQKQIRRGYARAAEGLLMDLAGRQDAYYAKARHYTSDFGPLLGTGTVNGVTMSGATQIYFDETGALSTTASASQRFTMVLTNPGSNLSYQLQLSVNPASKQWATGECGQWSVTNLGQRTSQRAGSGSSFTADASATCWLE